MGRYCAWISGGTANRKGGTTEAIARWTGSRWHITAPPVPASRRKLYFPGIASDGRGGLWAYGFASLSPRNTQLWHFKRNTWSRQTPGQKVEAGQPLALIPGSTSFWALGTASENALALVTRNRRN